MASEMTQKVLARAEFESGGYKPASPNLGRTFQDLQAEWLSGALAENTRLLPIIQELLSVNEKMAEALLVYQSHWNATDERTRIMDYDLGKYMLSEHSRVMKGLAGE